MISEDACLAGIGGIPNHLARAVEARRGSGCFYYLIGRVAVNPQKLLSAAHAPLHAVQRAQGETDLLRLCTSHSAVLNMIPAGLFPPVRPLRNPA